MLLLTPPPLHSSAEVEILKYSTYEDQDGFLIEKLASYQWAAIDVLVSGYENNKVESTPLKSVKVRVKDPFNNRKTIANIAKNQKGIYVWETLDGKHMYVGHSINLYNRISSPIVTATYLGINRRPYYSSLTRMNPWFLTGFLDGESSFYIVVQKSNNVKIGWSVRAVFEIHLHLKHKTLLEEIQTRLGGVGNIRIIDNKVSFKIYYRDLAILLNHLNNYPLITKKASGF